MVVAEHAGPFMCPGCLRLVTPCLVSVKEAIFVCQPLTSRPMPAGPPKQTAAIETITGSGDGSESDGETIPVLIDTDPQKVM